MIICIREIVGFDCALFAYISEFYVCLFSFGEGWGWVVFRKGLPHFQDLGLVVNNDVSYDRVAWIMSDFER